MSLPTASPDVEITASDLGASPLSLTHKLKATFLLLSLLSVLSVHSPFLPTTVQAFGHAFTNLVGQEHRWNMFSADPRGDSLNLKALLVLEDGRTRDWTIDRDRFGGDLAFYHWVKWMETAVLEPYKARLPEFAGWLALSSSDAVSEVFVFGERRLGPPAGKPAPPPVVIELGHYKARADGSG